MYWNTAWHFGIWAAFSIVTAATVLVDPRKVGAQPLELVIRRRFQERRRRGRDKSQARVWGEFCDDGGVRHGSLYLT
jgi:hypothetical protein